jgi:hypothetical protein
MHRVSTCALLVVGLAAFAGCGGQHGLVFGGGVNGSGGDGADAGPDASGPPSFGPVCGSDATTVSGTVYDPAGVNPLYNVIVYVPSAPLAPLTDGPTCDQCGTVASGSPVATALTDESGHFVLQGVPPGSNVPLVMQVGKWRREVLVPDVAPCTETKLTDHDMTRLPRNQGEGDMPKMALTTGGCDSLECLFYKIGIDESEFTASTGSGRVHVYTGQGGTQLAGAAPAPDLWGSLSNLMAYDIVLLSCECDTYPLSKPQAALQAMHDYANAGGRVFGTHYHYYWLESGPQDFQSTAQWTPNANTGSSALTYTIDQTLPKGQAFAQWMLNVGGSLDLGSIRMNGVSGDVSTVTTSLAQQWIYNPSPQSAKYYTFNTPVGADPSQQCGRFVYSDLHVSGHGNEAFPSACGIVGQLTPQEKALEFLFFDLAACVQDPTKPPPPPPIK